MSAKQEAKVPFLVRVPKPLFDQLEPLRNQGGYETRNDAVIDALEKAVKRVVKS
jgi:metal-responsive CopG/Arc/MetJ family transcriptional regulator